MRLGRFFGWMMLVVAGASGTAAKAAGPRWVTGAPYFYPTGNPVVWYTDRPRYFTDQGDLSATVSHDAADALVAAAAAVWTIPTSRFVLAYGGSLDEDVSSANMYAGADGIALPADLESGNYAAKQIAVIYDRDGAVTDLLLGGGASDPVECLQHGVTEDVDAVDIHGKILHALVILNGRCTGPKPEQQLQMQYQLIRAFGRVIGLGWSQTNDNVFTGSPQPSYQQALHWPIMHPLDIVCGPYTYQCLPQPFTLRPDDISSLDYLYPVSVFSPAAGKEDTWLRGNKVRGTVAFENGQGMQGVNVVVQRLEPFWNIPEAWQTVSSVSGFLFRRDAVTAVDDGNAGSNMGSTWGPLEGYYELSRIPIMDGVAWQSLIVTTEAINPLYTGEYAVGPYDANAVTPSGTTQPAGAYVVANYSDTVIDLRAQNGAGGCGTKVGGSESSPGALAADGWWRDVLCGYGQTAWLSVPVRARRTLTIEATAEDEQGFASGSKVMPVLGVWHGTDAGGQLPTVAAAPVAFNSTMVGMTALAVATQADETLRIAIADQRGDGRPDYAYRGRVLYADSVAPSKVDASGGAVTISGMGFRAGMKVTVNGRVAAVTSWSATSLTVALAPAWASGVTSELIADVVVTDPQTKGSSTMYGAVTYAAPTEQMTLVSAPTGTVYAGDTTPVGFGVKVVLEDGITPVQGESVVFSANATNVMLGCGAATCTVTTDASGLASTTVTVTGAGDVVLSAAALSGSVQARFTAAQRMRSVTPVQALIYVAEGATVNWTAQMRVSDNSAGTAGVPVAWRSSAGSLLVSQPSSLVDSQGVAKMTVRVGPLQGGELAVGQACAWQTVCAQFSGLGVAQDKLMVSVMSGDGQTIGVQGLLAPVTLQVTDGEGHGVAGAAVEVHQTIEAWGMSCPQSGRCPIAPVLASSQESYTSDLQGMMTVPVLQRDAAGVTRMAAAVGTGGLATVSLEKHP